MAAGFRGPLAPWVGGAGASSGAEAPATVGFRGLLAPWVGGVSAPAGAEAPATVGFRGALAPWVGGAVSSAAAPPPAPGPEPTGGRRVVPFELLDAQRRGRLRIDDALLLLAAAYAADIVH